MDGEVEKARELGVQLELRSLPYQYAQNNQSRFSELYNLNYGYFWTVALYQIYLGDAG